jgi:hypothetical protein
MSWYEITSDGSRRPNFPEDNMIYIEAENMGDALERFKNLMRDITIRGDIVGCRKVSFIFSDRQIQKLKEKRS